MKNVLISLHSTRSVLQSIAAVDTELAQSIKPFTKYIDVTQYWVPKSLLIYPSTETLLSV